MFFTISLFMVFSVLLSVLLIGNPIMVMVTVLIGSIGVASLISCSMSSYLGLITVIIYVGGMLVMFAYFVALDPNQVFSVWSLVGCMGFYCLAGFTDLTVFGVGVGFNDNVFVLLESSGLLVLVGVILFFAMVVVTKVVVRVWGAFR